MNLTIKTILALPGVGKSSYCQNKAVNGLGSGPLTWRPEPTEDIEFISKLKRDQVNNIVLQRMTFLDIAYKAEYRDSDYWTASFLFGGKLDQPYLAPVSDCLVYLHCSPEQQKQNILNRNRPFNELQYCEPYWHDKVLKAAKAHPAKTKFALVHCGDFNWIEDNQLTKEINDSN